MKTIFFSCLVCFVMAAPAFSELTPEDLDKIRLIIKEEISESEARMRTEIATVRTEIATVRTEIATVKEEVAEMRGRLEGIEKQIIFSTNFTYGLIALIVAAIAIPQIIMSWRGRKDSALERKVEELTREMETLKQQRILNP